MCQEPTDSVVPLSSGNILAHINPFFWSAAKHQSHVCIVFNASKKFPTKNNYALLTQFILFITR